MWLQAQSLVGLVAIPAIAWAISERRWAIPPARLARILLGGIGLQVLIAGLLLNVPAARAAFDWADGMIAALQSATGTGMRLVFGYLAGGPAPFETVRPETSFILAFQALPLILVISALSKLLYHWGVLQRIVYAIGWVLQRSLGVTGPVGTSAAANVFVGMVEAPLLVRPVPRQHEPRRAVRHHDGRHGGRGRHGAGALRHHPGAAAAGRGGAPDRRLRHQRAGRADARRADGAGPRTACGRCGAGRRRHRHRRSPAFQHGRHRPGHARGHRAAGQRYGHAGGDGGAGGAGQPAGWAA